MLCVGMFLKGDVIIERVGFLGEAGGVYRCPGRPVWLAIFLPDDEVAAARCGC
jgi:hypothetical protein